MLLLDRYMGKYIRFPTGTRFGWLGFLTLAITFAALEDKVFPVNGFLGRILGLLGIVAGLVCVIEFFDHSLGGAEDSIANLKHPVIHNTKRPWVQTIRRPIEISLLILATIVVVFMLWTSL